MIKSRCTHTPSNAIKATSQIGIIIDCHLKGCESTLSHLLMSQTPPPKYCLLKFLLTCAAVESYYLRCLRCYTFQYVVLNFDSQAVWELVKHQWIRKDDIAK